MTIRQQHAVLFTTFHTHTLKTVAVCGKLVNRTACWCLIVIIYAETIPLLCCKHEIEKNTVHFVGTPKLAVVQWTSHISPAWFRMKHTTVWFWHSRGNIMENKANDVLILFQTRRWLTRFHFSGRIQSAGPDRKIWKVNYQEQPDWSVRNKRRISQPCLLCA